MITKEKAIDILDKIDFFQGQRAGRELWNDKPFEVQEQDIKDFSNGVALLKEYISDVVPKSEEGAECPTCHGTGRIGTTDWLTKNISKKQLAEEKAKAIAEHEQYIKTEVAREIFEEIERAEREWNSMYSSDYFGYGGSAFGYLQTDVEHTIYELKKKYTEGGAEE